MRAMDPFMRRRSTGDHPEVLQVMRPTAPSGEIQGPNATDGEGVEGHQDLVPAMSAGPMGSNDQQNQGLANGVSPPERVGTGQSYGRIQALAASSQDQVPIQGAGLDLVSTGIGEHHAPQTPQPFATALSQTYGATDQAIGPLQVGVTTTTVVQQAQAGLRQGFQWLGEIVHRTMGNVRPGEFQIDPLLVPSPLPSVESPPGQVDAAAGVVVPTTPSRRLRPPATWDDATRPPEGVAPLFTQEQLQQFRRMQQASPQLYGPQIQDEQSSSNTTDIQAEVRRQVSEFMAQQAQAMNHLQRENAVLRERLDAQQSPPQLTQSINPNPKVDLPQPQGQPRSFHPGRGEALVPLQGSSAPQEGVQAPEGKGIGGLGIQVPTQHPQTAQPSGLNLAALAGSITGRREAISVVPTAERQGYAAGVPSASGTKAQVGASALAERPSYVSAGPVTGSGIPGAHAQVPNSAGHLPSVGTVPNPMIAGNQDLLTGLVSGMRQLQEVLIQKETQQTTTSSDEPETVKPGVSSLPKLKAIDSESSPIDFQDWVTLLKAPMCDLSATSHLWWPKVVQEAEATYTRFATSGPIERLGITPNITDELITGKWSRVNSRATTMLLAAIEDDLRVEMVNRRMCDSAVGILYRLMTLYAPGGESEKSLTLKKLQTPTRCTDPQLAADELRAWERWKKRAETLGLLTPDPTILVKGLASITSGILEKAVNREIAFRTSLVRSVLQVDSKPTMDTVMQFHGHLLGEMEQLASTAPRKGVANQTSNPNANNNQEPQVKGLQANQPNDAASKVEAEKARKASIPCRFFGKKDSGCPKGKNCVFKHDWTGIPEKPPRCRSCAGLGHFAQDCPNSKGDNPKGKGKSKGKGDGKGKDNSAGANTQGGNAIANKTVVIEEVPQSQSASSSSGTPQPTIVVQTTTPPTTTPDLKTLIADLSSALKSEAQIHMKALEVDHQEKVDLVIAPANGGQPRQNQVQENTPHQVQQPASRKVEPVGGGNDPIEGETGLVDSGATHALREGTQEEMRAAKHVPVTLAGDEKSTLCQSQLGTILMPHPTQPLVPMGALVEVLGCSVKWTPKVLKITHPKHGNLKVSLRNRCPEIAALDALNLIQELEAKQLEQFNSQVREMELRLEAMQAEEEKDWIQHIHDVRKDGSAVSMWKALMKCPFTKDLPSEVLELMIEGFDPNQGWKYLKDLPLTRKQRKRLMNSHDWIVHLYAGERDNTPYFKQATKDGQVFLEIDITRSKSWDLNQRASVYRALIWAACGGRISSLMGGPPCRTWSILRSRPKVGFPGPERDAQHLYGLDELDPKERLKVNQDTALVAKHLWIWTLAACSRSEMLMTPEEQALLSSGLARVPLEQFRALVGFLMEHPQDPQRYREATPEVQKCPSVWRTTMWKAFKRIFGISEVHFDQGALGHKTVKPTTLGTGLDGLLSLDGLKANTDQFTGATEVPSHLLAEWAPQLKSRIANAIASQHQPVPSSPERVEQFDEVIRSARLSAVERAAWQAHLQNDHVPYRADCSTCLLAAATGHRHRRVKHPCPFSLALDIAGPFKTEGRDFDESRYRYLLVGAYRLPVQFFKDPSVKDDEVPEDNPLEGDGVSGPDPFELEADDWQDPEYIPDFEEEVAHEEPQEGSGDAESSEEKDELEEKVKELTKPLELRTLYMVQPLLSRKGPEVLQAVQQFKVQLGRRRLPSQVVHSDRAKEFQTRAMKAWMADQGIHHSRSSGSEPAGNSTAELGVRWVKARTRALLTDVHAKEWPLAAQHAAQKQWNEKLPPTGRNEDKISPAFGQVVWFKAKAYVGKEEQKADEAKAKNPDLPPRWKKGFYRGRALDVPNGHIIAREDGGLVIAKGAREKVVIPEEIEPPLLPELEADLELPDPSHRVTGKTAPPEGVGSAGEAAIAKMDTKTRQTMVDEILGHSRVVSLVGSKAPKVRPQADSQEDSVYRLLGVFQHGGVVGLSTLARDYPDLAAKVCKLIRHDHPGHTFTSIMLSRNTRLPIHRDRYNDKTASNLISPLVMPSDGSGGIWVELGLGDPVLSSTFEYRTVNGERLPGNLLDLKTPARVKPDRWHGSEKWDTAAGDRIILVAYTVSGWRKMKPEQRECLSQLGFNLPSDSHPQGGVDDMSHAHLTGGQPQQSAQPMVKAMRAGNGQGRSNSQDSSGSSSSQQHSPTSSAASGEQGSSDSGSHHHDVGELAARLAEQLGLEITSSDEEFDSIHNFFGDVPGYADDLAYRFEVVEERVRAWAYANPRPPLGLINVDGLTPIEIQAVHMGAGYYMMRPRRNQPSRDSTPSPPPVGGPSLRALQVPSQDSTCKARMMSVGFPSHEEPGTSFELLDPEEVSQMRIEEIQQELKEAALPQLVPQLKSLQVALRKAEALYTPNVEALLAQLEEEQKPLEVVHTVELKEVKEHLAKWVPSAKKELENLVSNKKAFRVMKRHLLPKGTRLVPGKGVFTVKPDGNGYRRKTRFVACGNYLPNDEVGDLYAAGADATTLRAILSYSAGRPWVAGTTDIRQAFVLAPWKGGPVAVTPPKIAVDMGLCEPDDVWFVDQALYGLRESPKLWGDFRDSELKLATWEVEGAQYHLQQMSSDDQLWRITKHDLRKDGPVSPVETLGFILVYVDDIFTVGDAKVIGGFHDWLSSKWECDPVAMLAADKPIRFLGMEINLGEDGQSFELSQKRFIEELLRAHDHKGSKSWSMGPRDLLMLTPEEEEELLQDTAPLTGEAEPAVRQAQRRVGELLWLMSRTRPDLQYVVALMASRATKSPEVVNKIGQRLLDYLYQTLNYRLVFNGCEESELELSAYTDSSFAPAGARSHGAAVVVYRGSPICWRSSRQALVTLSTAESELVEAVEGALLLKSCEGTIAEIAQRSPELTLPCKPTPHQKKVIPNKNGFPKKIAETCGCYIFYLLRCYCPSADMAFLCAGQGRLMPFFVFARACCFFNDAAFCLLRWRFWQGEVAFLEGHRSASNKTLM